MQFIEFIKDRISALFTEESGQDGIEYLLVIGGVSVAIITAVIVLATATPGIVTAVCTQVATVVPGVSC